MTMTQVLEQMVTVAVEMIPNKNCTWKIAIRVEETKESWR